MVCQSRTGPSFGRFSNSAGRRGLQPAVRSAQVQRSELPLRGRVRIRRSPPLGGVAHCRDPACQGRLRHDTAIPHPVDEIVLADYAGRGSAPGRPGDRRLGARWRWVHPRAWQLPPIDVKNVILPEKSHLSTPRRTEPTDFSAIFSDLGSDKSRFSAKSFPAAPGHLAPTSVAMSRHRPSKGECHAQISYDLRRSVRSRCWRSKRAAAEDIVVGKMEVPGAGLKSWSSSPKGAPRARLRHK